MSLFSKKWPAKFSAAIYNSPYTYVLLLALIITQAIFVLWLFFSFRAVDFAAWQQMNSKMDKISVEQSLLNEKFNNLQSTLLLIQSQLYRQ